MDEDLNVNLIFSRVMQWVFTNVPTVPMIAATNSTMEIIEYTGKRTLKGDSASMRSASSNASFHGSSLNGMQSGSCHAE